MKIKFTTEFEKWMASLRDLRAKAKITMRIKRIENGDNLGDFKPLGDGLNELRIRTGPGYRVYFTHENGQLVVLIAGGDKSSQSRDIEKAKKIMKEIEQRRSKKND